jgi:hypothetical protein
MYLIVTTAKEVSNTGAQILLVGYNKEDLYSSIIETITNKYCPGTMNIYFIRDRLEQKRLSGIP